MADKVGYTGAIDASGRAIPQNFTLNADGTTYSLNEESAPGAGQLAPSITVSTSPAYSAGDSVGGLLTLTNALRSAGQGAVLQSLFLRDTSNQKAALELLIFNANPSSSTFTDNAAAVIHANDVDKIIRRISILASDYVTIDSKAFVDLAPGGRVLTAASGVDLYAALIAVGTPTYAATGALGLRLGTLQD